VAAVLGGDACGARYDVFTKYVGFHEWALRNNFAVLCPKLDTRGPTAQMRSGCFDGYGQGGRDYDLQSGARIETVANMIRALRRAAEL
jgi:hypothetical protein